MPEPCGALPVRSCVISLHYCETHGGWSAHSYSSRQASEDPGPTDASHVEFGPFDDEYAVLSWVVSTLHVTFAGAAMLRERQTPFPVWVAANNLRDEELDAGLDY